MSRCLLLIDLQNEFLSSEGNFPIHEHCRPFLAHLGSVVDLFCIAGGPVYWIRSEYGASDPASITSFESDSFSSGTHTGRKGCCEKGSFGAQFPEDIAALIKDSHLTITKTWYSAFKETTLLSDLNGRGITDLYVGGLLTNVCVQATAAEALALNFHVHVLEDCLGWRNRGSHDKALRNMRDFGVQVTSSTHLIKEHSESTSHSPGTTDGPTLMELRPHIPQLYYVNGSIPSWRVMMVLYEKAIQFEPKRLKVMSNPRETRLPPFLTLNHRGKTPVFVDVIPPSSDSDTGMTVNINESLAIMQYLETYYCPETPLLPPISRRVERALALSRVQETENLHHAYDALEEAYFVAADKSAAPLDDLDREKLIQDVHSELDFWEVYAGKTMFIAGDDFGLADCAFFPILAYMVHRGFEWRRTKSKLGVDDSSNGTKKTGKKNGPTEVNAWPNLKAYFERVWSRHGENGCAQRAQPDGWHRRGKANVWKGKPKPLRETDSGPTLSP